MIFTLFKYSFFITIIIIYLIQKTCKISFTINEQELGGDYTEIGELAYKDVSLLVA